jgi:hypothetical protein
MKKTWLWLAVSTAAFLLALWGWEAAPVDYDMSDIMFSGVSAVGYWLYQMLYWAIGAVKYLLAAGYALALFAVLRQHPRRFTMMLLTGAALTALGVLGLAGVFFWGWFYTRWMMRFVVALFTSGLLILVLSFALRLFKREPRVGPQSGIEQ